MAPRKGRHPRRSKGPGGPRRTTRMGRAEVIPITRAPGARTHEGLLRPSIDGLVRSLLSSLRALAPSDPEARPIGIEVWADRMAATVYGVDQMPPDFYVDLAGGLLSSPDTDAPAALAALALVLDHDDAAGLREAHDERRARVGPDDASDQGIGRATPRRAFEVDHVQGDGVTLLVELDQPGSPHCVGVYIDHTLGGLAKDLLVGPPWATVEASYRERAGITVREVALADVRARYEAAVDLTDHTYDPPVADDFEDTRPLVERRMALLAEGGTVTDHPAPDDDEVEALVAAFLASPEAAALSPRDRNEAGWLVDLWIHHATGEAVGSPFRLSPMLVEVFCIDWFPHRSVADAQTAAAAPVVLTAWARYAARLTDLDDVWLDEALAAIATSAPAMADVAPGRDPQGGPVDDLDDLDPELREALRRELPGRGLHVADAEDEREDGAPMTDAVPPPDRSWVPLVAVPPGPRRVHWEADASAVDPEVATKVKAICLRASAHADQMLGPAFVQPAVELAIAIGRLDPSPLPHTRDDVWSSAVVWLLADDSGAFTTGTPGRTRDDLAADLPVARATITKRVTQIRDLLDLAPGSQAVDW